MTGKKRGALTAALLVLLCLAGTALAEWATICNDRTGDRLNLRAGPSKGETVLGKYYAGTIASRTGAVSSGYTQVRADGWIQVVYQNETCYTRAGATTSRLAY